MTPRLVACPSCRRHVFAHDERCPFCATPQRPSRFAPVVIGAALALAACESPPSSDSARPDRRPAAVYGGPPTELRDAKPPPDDWNNQVAVYGGPPTSMSTTPPAPSPSATLRPPAPVYGGPPTAYPTAPPTAKAPPSGAPIAAYGAPPTTEKP